MTSKSTPIKKTLILRSRIISIPIDTKCSIPCSSSSSNSSISSSSSISSTSISSTSSVRSTSIPSVIRSSSLPVRSSGMCTVDAYRRKERNMNEFIAKGGICKCYDLYIHKDPLLSLINKLSMKSYLIWTEEEINEIINVFWKHTSVSNRGCTDIQLVSKYKTFNDNFKLLIARRPEVRTKRERERERE